SIELTATNNCGVASQIASVTYNEPVSPPAITFSSACNVEVQAGTHYVSGFISNVNNASQVMITVNGNPVNNASYASANQGLNFAFNLNAAQNPGVYNIVIVAQNAGGQYTENCKITVKQPPVVDNDLVICARLGRKWVTMTIKESQWPQYQ